MRRISEGYVTCIMEKILKAAEVFRNFLRGHMHNGENSEGGRIFYGFSEGQVNLQQFFSWVQRH